VVDQVRARTYHRLRSSTQTDDMAERQVESGEVWGRTPRWGNAPKVQAYVGPLPSGRAGIEFTTDVEPDSYGLPHEASWSGPRPGVEVDGEFAKIRVSVTTMVRTADVDKR
jgi:hypothetical protein